MKKFFIKILILFVSVLLLATIFECSEEKLLLYSSGVSYLILFISASHKALRKQDHFYFFKILALLNLLFVPIYIINIHWLTLPSIVIMFYIDVVGNRKEFINKIYEQEERRRYHIERCEKRKRECETFRKNLQNLYHEKNGRCLYIVCDTFIVEKTMH